MNKPFISIVSPVYKAENMLVDLVRRIESAVSQLTSNFEIILVEDCGPDKSWEMIEKIAESNNRVKGFKLSRNFGQHYAITCGLDQAQGDWVVVMDCDLQDQPEEIIKLFNKAQEGYDIVFGKRSDRKDSFIKRFISRMFYRTLGYLTGSKLDEQVANFGIYNEKVVGNICKFRESIRFFPTMVKWVGFKATSISVDHSARFEGQSSYNFKKLLNLGLDIILAYSDKPIILTIKLGFLVSFLTLLFGLYNFYLYLTNQIIVPGYTSLILSIWFLSGLIISILGIVGLYIGKIFEGVKSRPIYIISEITISSNDVPEIKRVSSLVSND
jgi:glycosyltransferase involved in cell wall biosynthesis